MQDGRVVTYVPKYTTNLLSYLTVKALFLFDSFYLCFKRWE